MRTSQRGCRPHYEHSPGARSSLHESYHDLMFAQFRTSVATDMAVTRCAAPAQRVGVWGEEAMEQYGSGDACVAE